DRSSAAPIQGADNVIPTGSGPIAWGTELYKPRGCTGDHPRGGPGGPSGAAGCEGVQEAGKVKNIQGRRRAGPVAVCVRIAGGEPVQEARAVQHVENGPGRGVIALGLARAAEDAVPEATTQLKVPPAHETCIGLARGAAKGIQPARQKRGATAV